MTKKKPATAQYEVTFAGFGGQGIMVAGQLLAYAGIHEGLNVVWLPSYGPEMRGGTAYCTVVVSEARIGSPIINSPRAACVFNRPSFDKFTPKVKPGGLIVVNSSLIDVTTDRQDITEILVPANQIAMDVQNNRSANLAVLGAFTYASEVVPLATMQTVVKEKLGKKANLLESNLEALQRGFDLARDLLKGKQRQVAK